MSRTQPQVNIFPSSIEDLTWHLPAVSSPPYNTTADAVPRMLSSSLTLASVAKARINNTGPYLGTTQVARDMLSIAQAFGRDKVQYWGFSSVLRYFIHSLPADAFHRSAMALFLAQRKSQDTVRYSSDANPIPKLRSHVSGSYDPSHYIHPRQFRVFVFEYRTKLRGLSLTVCITSYISMASHGLIHPQVSSMLRITTPVSIDCRIH